jgi:hypothetical protein
MDIVIVRLLTGEDILCELSDVSREPSPEVLEIKNPVRIVVMPSKADPKVPSIGLAPWCEFNANKTVSLRREHILYIIEPVADFKNQYKSMFGGIITPTKNLILPE